MSGRLTGFYRFLKSHGIQDVESQRLRTMSVENTKGGVLGHLFQEFRTVERMKVELGESKKRVSTYLLLSAYMAVLLTFPDLELNYRSRQLFNTEYSSVQDMFSAPPAMFIAGFVISIVMTLLSLLTTALIYRYYTLELNLLKIRHRVPENASLCKLPSRYPMAIELVISFLHVPPLLHLYIPPELQLIVLCRMYHLFRFLKNHNTIAKSTSIRLLVSFMQKDLSDAFQFKSFFMKHPFTIIFTLYLYDAFVIGYVVFALDRAAGLYRSYKDVTWLMVVTMTSLGFGDVVPNSIGGRVFISLSSIFGILLMALVIGVVQQALMLTEDEKRVLAYDEYNKFVKNRKIMAARCIQAVWRIHNCTKHGRYKGVVENESAQRLRFKLLLHQLYVTLNDWRQISRLEIDARLRDSMVETLNTQMTNVDRKVERLETSLTNRRRSSLAHGAVPLQQPRKDSACPAPPTLPTTHGPFHVSAPTPLPPISGRLPPISAGPTSVVSLPPISTSPVTGTSGGAPVLPEDQAIESILKHLEQLEQRTKIFFDNVMDETAAIRLLTVSAMGRRGSKSRREKDGLPQVSLPSLVEEAEDS
ncbi:small conductance calcium-activated potassium channel protein 3-like [Branchiostoma floridae x Branchiostoma belcheri]